MEPTSRHLAISQLDDRLGNYRNLANQKRPHKGWIRAIRDALGMTASQLGRRARVSQQAITQAERSEAEDKISLSTLRKLGNAMDCTLVYALVPNSTLDDVLTRRTKEVARRTLERTEHTMALEAQDVSKEQIQKHVDMLARQLYQTLPRNLWDQNAD